ncbi:hypothetical protein Tco_0089652 [Tanacetum coccineum]
MDRRPLITELRSNVGSSDWTNVLSYFCQKVATEDRRGIISPGKAAEFLKDTLRKDDVEMAQLRELERQMELRALEKELEFAIRMNRLVGEMNEACQDRIAFVRELESVVGSTVTAKTVVFLKEMIDKEGSREWQLRDFGKEAKERALEIELFVQKLMRD